MDSIHRSIWNSGNSSTREGRFERSRGQRRSSNHCLLAKLACVLFLTCSLSLAQHVVAATANIPFDFWAEGQNFAAGEYTFDTSFPGSIARQQKRR